MAFALALKSKFDFQRVGTVFLLLTLIITAFTLIYSSLFLELTLNSCDVIIKETSNCKEKLLQDNKHDLYKKDQNIKEESEENKNLINYSFLHEDLNEYEDDNKNITIKPLESNEQNKIDKNYFVYLKYSLYDFNEKYLIPLVDRHERLSIKSNISHNELKMKDLKKSFLNINDDL